MKYKLCSKDGNKENKYDGKRMIGLKKVKFYIRLSIGGIIVGVPLVVILAKKGDEIYRSIELKMHNKPAITSMDQIIDEVTEFAKELKIDNPMKLCGFIKKLIYNGHLSYNGKYCYDKKNAGKDLYDFIRYREIDVVMGLGVCRSEASLVVKVLNKCGYEAYSINNKLTYNNEVYNHEFTLICYKNSAFIYDLTNDTFFVFKGNRFSPIMLHENENGVANMRIIPTYLAHQIDFDDIFRIYGHLFKNENNITEEKIENEYEAGKRLYHSLDETVINAFVSSIEDEKEIIAENVLKYKKH